jgi:transposase
MDVAIGIDSHKRSLGVGVIDERGREVTAGEFCNDRRGHEALLKWARSQGDNRIIGIEGSGSYGAGVARFLLTAGEDVREVPAFVAHRERKKSPSKGKSDLTDAIAIARVVARGDGLFSPRRNELLQDLKLLSDHRGQLVRARTQIINRTHKDLVISYPGYERSVPKLKSKKQLDSAMKLLRGDPSVRAGLVRHNISELRRLNRTIAEVEKDIVSKIKQSGTTLTHLRGIGFMSAAKILGEVGTIGRIRSKAGFAMLNGTAPLQASSGSRQRHRLNRGGNRQLNYALHMMAIARCNSDEDTKAYIARRQMEGKTKKEAMRCLKRHLSNIVYQQMEADAAQLATMAA